MPCLKTPVLALLATLIGCSVPVAEPAPWQGRGAPASTDNNGGTDQPELTLGTPFFAVATAIDAASPANVEFSFPGAGHAAGQDRGLAPIDQAQLVLHSDGFVIALESIELHLGAIAGYVSDVRVRAEGVVTGNVLAADPDMVRAEFEVWLILEGKLTEDGSSFTSVADKPMLVSMRVMRTGDTVQIAAAAGRDAAAWDVGAARLQGGPMNLRLSGVLLAP